MMMKRYNFQFSIFNFQLVAVALLVLSSCQVVNKYQTPDIDTDNLYRDFLADDTASIATMPWREYFADTCLQSLIEEGLEANVDLRIASARIKQAEANLLTARLAYLPSVSLAGQYQHNNSDVYVLGLGAQWEVDLWGKLNRQQRASYAQYLNSKVYRQLVQTSLIANIANSYFSLLALDEQLRITRETIVLLQESTATMQAMMDAGLLNRAAVDQSQALLYSTQISIPTLENQIRRTENALSILLARKPGGIRRLDIRIQNVPEMMKYGVPAQLLARRPDVRQAELNFRAAFELTNAAQAALYPSITLNSGSMIGYSSTNTLKDFFSPDNLVKNIVAGLTMPLFARNQLLGQVKIRKAQQEEALLTFGQSVLSAGAEVSNILYTFESSKKKTDLRTAQIMTLQQAVDDTQSLLKAGEANYTEVLTAEQSLLSAQLAQVSDKLEQIQAVVNLYRALGGGSDGE
jgi:NodT family efflux transporter outer membrane factor (OMF) lipoprotein